MSDRVGNHSNFLSSLATVGATILCYLSHLRRCFRSVTLAFTWVSDNQGSASERGAGLVIFGMAGQAGSIAGFLLFLQKTDHPI